MASLNKVTLIGNLGRDPEMRYLPNGDAVANIALATTETWKDKNTGEKKEATEWHRVTFYRRLAEIAGQYLKKGGQIYIEGRLQTRKWTDKDGVERYTTEIIGETMKMLGGRHGGGAQQDDDGYGSPAPQRQGASADDYQRAKGGSGAPRTTQRPAPNFNDLDDDIPF